METLHCDVLIIGAGPAGSTAGRIVAQAGLDCVIIEQARFPREKVCGECLSSVGVEVLRRTGMLHTIVNAGARWIDRAAIHAMNFRAIDLRLRSPMLGVSRGKMDLILRDGAVEAGARMLQPARCERLDGSNAIVRCLQTNRMLRVESRQVIVADGKGATGMDRPQPTGDLGIKAHLTGVVAPAGLIELFGGRGFYAGLAEIEQERWNLAMAVPKSVLRSCEGCAQRVFERLCTQCPVLRDRTGNARVVGDWHASPLPRFAPRSNWPDGIIPVGNALSAIEPIGGEGMGMAMRSAECVARRVAAATVLPLIDERLPPALRSIWGTRGRACRTAARAVSSPAMARLAMPIAGAFPLAVARWARLVGK